MRSYKSFSFSFRNPIALVPLLIVSISMIPIQLMGQHVQQKTAVAVSRYVAVSGSDTNPGTFAQPYATIPKAITASVAGDSIFVRGGTYSLSTTISISKNGTAGAKLYLLNYPGERPLLDFSSMAVGSSNRGINLGKDYWYIKGFDIKGAGDNGMNISGSNNIIEYCSFYENQDTGLQLGGGAANNQIINCDSYFNVDTANGNADGFAPKLDVGTGNYFYGCRSWQNSDDGWDGYMRPADNINTTLENCWCFMNGYLKSGAISAGNGNGFKMGGGDNSNSDSLRHNMTLKRCIAFDNRVKGFDQNNNRGSMTLLNCTAYRNGTNISISAGLKSGSVLTVKNSVSILSTGIGGGVTLSGSAVLATNSWQAPFVVSSSDFVSLDTTGVRGPRQSDGTLPELTFLHLTNSSDLVEAGTDVGLVFSGAHPDLGAFENITILPVELTFFNAVKIRNTVSLQWNTATEVDNFGFVIERRIVPISQDRYGRWDNIGFIEGHGTINSPQTYLFVDVNPSIQNCQYRLRQIDRDGKSSYSETLVLNGETIPEVFSLEQNYPNPFNPSTIIGFTLPADGLTTLKVYDILGKEIATIVDGFMLAGTYQRSFTAVSLPSGIYYYQLRIGVSVSSKKMTVMK